MFKRATVNDIDGNRFRKQPKALDENECYKELSIPAKYLYGIMLDRFSLSKSKNWVNDDNEVYFIFKQRDLSNLMNVSVSSIKRYLEELIEYQLLQKQSTMTVNLYYITLEYQQRSNLNPRIGNDELTIDCEWSNNSDTDKSDTNLSDTENLRDLKSRAYTRFDNLEDGDIIKQINNIISENRKKITTDNYEKSKYIIDEIMEEHDIDTLNDMIKWYMKEKQDGRSVENFIMYKDRFLLNRVV